MHHEASKAGERSGMLDATFTRLVLPEAPRQRFG